MQTIIKRVCLLMLPFLVSGFLLVQVVQGASEGRKAILPLSQIARKIPNSLFTKTITPTIGWNVSQISDHNLSEGGVGEIFNMASMVADNVVHVAWVEQISAEDYALFYRRGDVEGVQEVGYVETPLPGLPNRYIYMQMVGDENGRVCITFTAGNSNLQDGRYLWCNDYAQPMRLDYSGPLASQMPEKLLLSEGSSPGQIIQMDTNGIVHARWIEAGSGSYQQELIYWNETMTNAVVLSDESTWSYIISSQSFPIEESMHIAWSEYADTGLFTPFYWDSTSNMVRNIGWPDAGYATGIQMLVDGNEALHIFWITDLDTGEAGCPVHWSADVSHLLGDDGGGCDALGLKTAVDYAGNIHAAWLGSPAAGGTQNTLFYWHTGMVTATVVITDVYYGSFDQLWLIPDMTNALHLLWTDDADLYYWNNVAQTAVNLSNDTNGDVVDDELAWIFDENNELHVVWPEGTTQANDIYYWSTASTTHHLSDPNLISGNGRKPALHETADNIIQISWQENTLTGTSALFQWDTQLLSTTQLIEIYPEDVNPLSIVFVADNVVRAAWIAESVGDNDLAAWRTGEEISRLSEMAGTSGDMVIDSESVQWHEGGNGRLHILWAEDTATSEGEDVFIATSIGNPQTNHVIYLPFITQGD